jgi:thiosulfate/3-mercaptopyruvate sulfurtransferase
MTDIAERGYTNPDVLVSTDWVAEHLNDDGVQLVESNEDQLLYSAGHVPGAVEIDWVADLNDALRRDYLDKAGFEALMQRKGITPETTVIFYGDRNNWWACYAYWVFQLFGHSNAKVMDGGRLKWEAEGKPTTRDVPSVTASTYSAPARDDSTVRAFRDDVVQHLEAGGQLVDVRSPAEYTGERLHMEDYPNEGALRGGHIPTAKNIPWARAANPEDGTFLPADQLKAIYLEEQQLDPSRATVAYCRIGERSSHTWFVLTHLLGFGNVRNYDGSWTEWGNLVGAPIER